MASGVNHGVSGRYFREGVNRSGDIEGSTYKLISRRLQSYNVNAVLGIKREGRFAVRLVIPRVYIQVHLVCPRAPVNNSRGPCRGASWEL